MTDYLTYKKHTAESELEYLVSDFFISLSNSYVHHTPKSPQTSKELADIFYSFYFIIENGNITISDRKLIDEMLLRLYDNKLDNNGIAKLLFKFFEVAEDNGIRVDFRYNEKPTQLGVPADMAGMLIVKYFKTIANALLDAERTNEFHIAFKYLVCFWASLRPIVRKYECEMFGERLNVDELCFSIPERRNVMLLFRCIMKKATEAGLFLSEQEMFNYE